MIGERASGLGVQARSSLPSAAILDLCDRVLSEIGRRQHLFAWLRPLGSPDGWLPVDAYYPANRLIVKIVERPGEHDHLFAELAPKHGLRLLQFPPTALGGDVATAERALRDLVSRLGPPPLRPGETVAAPRRSRPTDDGPRPPRERPLARAAASLAALPPPRLPHARQTSASRDAAVTRARRYAQTRKPAPRARRPRPAPPVRRTAPAPRPRARPQPPGADAEALGLVLGLTLLAVLLFECYLDVAQLALVAGQLVLAFGIALDACARALGTVAARRAQRQGWAWACALVGSPAVAAFALFQADGPVAVDPAPLAGLLSLLACGVIVVGLLAAIV